MKDFFPINPTHPNSDPNNKLFLYYNFLNSRIIEAKVHDIKENILCKNLTWIPFYYFNRKNITPI